MLPGDNLHLVWTELRAHGFRHSLPKLDVPAFRGQSQKPRTLGNKHLFDLRAMAHNRSSKFCIYPDTCCVMPFGGPSAYNGE